MRCCRYPALPKLTLNDYTHCISSEPGFNHETDEFLRREAKLDDLKDWQRYVMFKKNLVM
jgi:hypothetical protein